MPTNALTTNCTVLRCTSRTTSRAAAQTTDNSTESRSERSLRGLEQKHAALRVELAAATTEAERQRVQQQLSELGQALALRLEGMRASGHL